MKHVILVLLGMLSVTTIMAILAWDEPLSLVNYENNGYRNELATAPHAADFSGQMVNDSLQMFYYANGNLRADLYPQITSFEGGYQNPDSGHQLLTDKGRSILDVKLVSAAENGVLCLLTERDIDSTQATLLSYNFIRGNRTFAFPEHIMLDYSNGTISSPKAERQSDGSFLIVWNTGGSICKMQKLSPNGNTVYPNNGIVLAENLENEFLIDIVNGEVYIATTPQQTEVKLHKFINGNRVWDIDGITVGTLHYSFPSYYIYLKSMENRYICWTIQATSTSQQKLVLFTRYDSDGSIAPFPITGLPLISPSNGLMATFISFFPFQDNMVVNHIYHYLYNNGGDSPEWIWESKGAMSMVKPNATLSNRELSYAGNYNGLYVLADQDCFYRSYNVYYENVKVAKYNQDATRLWLASTGFYGIYFKASLCNIPGGNKLGILSGLLFESNNWATAYFIFNENGTVTSHADVILQTGLEHKVTCQSSSDGAFMVYYNSNSAFVQYITAASDVSDPVLSPEAVFSVSSAYPNPFNNKVSWLLDLKIPASPTIDIYNSKGQKLRSLNYGHLEKGQTVIDWDGLDSKGHSCASGVYIVKISSASYSVNKRIVKLK